MPKFNFTTESIVEERFAPESIRAALHATKAAFPNSEFPELRISLIKPKPTTKELQAAHPIVVTITGFASIPLFDRACESISTQLASGEVRFFPEFHTADTYRVYDNY